MKRRKDGRYAKQMTYTLPNGEQGKKWFYGKTESEVMRQISEFRAEQSQGALFRTVAEQWASDHFPTLAYNTLKCYKPALRRSIERFGDRRISGITPNQLNAYIADFARKGYARKTVCHQLLVINLIMQRAVLDGAIMYNPAQEVKIPRGLPKGHRLPPSDSQLELVKKSFNAPFGLFSYLILYTGLRKGEALGLRYEDIDRNEKTAHVRRSVYFVCDSAETKAPKTSAGERDVILPDALLQKLPRKKRGFIFEGDTDQLLTASQYRRKWNEYTQATGASFTVHQLRHAYVTMLYDAGVADRDAMELSGHANISTMRDIYTHISKRRKQHIADTLNSIFI